MHLFFYMLDTIDDVKNSLKVLLNLFKNGFNSSYIWRIVLLLKVQKNCMKNDVM